MSEISEIAVEIAKSRYARKCAKKKGKNSTENTKDALIKAQAEKCAKMIFEVFRATENLYSVRVVENSKGLICGVKFYKSDLMFYQYQNLEHKFKKTYLDEAIQNINKLKVPAKTIQYIADILLTDKDIIKYYYIEYKSVPCTVTVTMKDIDELKTICENEESA